jgi:hypothetical protein
MTAIDTTTQDPAGADPTTIDQAKLEAFAGQAVGDMGAAISGLLLHIGDRSVSTRPWPARGP